MKVVASGERTTLVYSRIQPGAELPEHKHPHEQTGYCLEGEAMYRMGNMTFQVKKGHNILVPSNTVRSAKITEKEGSVILEAFSWPKPDLLRGEFTPEKLRVEMIWKTTTRAIT